MAGIDQGNELLDLQPTGTTGISFPSPQAFNAATPLTTPTYDGSGQCTEPSMIYMNGGWNGWKYWLANCPYPGADATKENPSLLVSNDGQTWQVPAGLTNPVVPKPTGGTNFDVSIFLDKDNKTMYMFWADTVATNGNVWSLQSTDGITWTNKTLHFTNLGAATWNTPLISWDGTQYHFFYMDLNGTITLRKCTGPTPLGPWSAPQATNVAGAVLNGNLGSHANIRYFAGKFYALISANGNGFVFWLSSIDGITWTLPTKPILTASAGTWDNAVYRSAFVFVQAGEGYMLQLWYSGFSAGNLWRIGYTTVSLTTGPINQGGGTLLTGQVRSSLPIGSNDHNFVAKPNPGSTDSGFAGFGIMNAIETLWLTRLNKDGTSAFGGLMTVTAGGIDVTGGARLRVLGAFVAADKYVVADASGNLHLSALGPAS
jgi:hypothetical protein